MTLCAEFLFQKKLQVASPPYHNNTDYRERIEPLVFRVIGILSDHYISDSC